MSNNIALTSVVLMAGYSKRMGQLKQHVLLEGESFLSHIIKKIISFPNDISANIFVGQDNDELGKRIVREHEGIWISNLHPDDGPISSIRLALDKILNSSLGKTIMLWPIDHPMVEIQTLEKIIKAFREKSDFITLPSDGTHRGHPAIFPEWCFNLLKNQDLKNGAKTLLPMFPDKINYVLTDDVWITKNINTPSLLEEAKRMLSVNC